MSLDQTLDAFRNETENYPKLFSWAPLSRMIKSEVLTVKKLCSDLVG
jgi:hypothetical protein